MVKPPPPFLKGPRAAIPRSCSHRYPAIIPSQSFSQFRSYLIIHLNRIIFSYGPADSLVPLDFLFSRSTTRTNAIGYLTNTYDEKIRWTLSLNIVDDYTRNFDTRISLRGLRLRETFDIKFVNLVSRYRLYVLH